MLAEHNTTDHQIDQVVRNDKDPGAAPDAVLGVDTHRDTHQAELATPTGVVLATLEVPNSTAGFTRLLAWIDEHAPGPMVLAAVEGTRSYGIGVARALSAAGITVLECEQPARSSRRGKGKSDRIDAHHAVLFAVRQDPERAVTPRSDGDREALRILLGARHDMTTSNTAKTNRLRALLLTGDTDRDRDTARQALTQTALGQLIRRRLAAGATRADTVRHAEIRRLATALRETAAQLTANNNQIRAIADDLAPGLTQRPGLGPVTAAQVIVSHSHPGRVRNDAAFAALAGTSPIPASSGLKTRHRLNRGGDRALNKAIHTIARTRMRCDPRTRDYVAKRTTEGKTNNEIRRCLKRYITRELYKALNPPPPTP